MSTTLQSPSVLNGTRFGTIEYEAADVVNFSEGLVGLRDYRQFVIVGHRPGSPFRWLQSLEDPDFAMLIVEPTAYAADYSPAIPESDLTAVDLSADDPRITFVTASIPAGNPKEMTLNLAGPIIVNPANREGVQVVLTLDSYTTRHRAFPSDSDGTSGKGEAA